MNANASGNSWTLEDLNYEHSLRFGYMMIIHV
jgi:hypothetical protein